MVALAIAAIGLSAISKVQSQNIDIAYRLETKTIANWIASNRMAELRMNRRFQSSGTDVSYLNMASLDWRIVDNYFATADPNISRIQVQIFLRDSNTLINSSTGFLSRYSRAKTQ